MKYVISENKSLIDLDLLNKLYPVGTVYTTVSDVDPNTVFGGTWVKIASGRCLMGADSSHGVGSTAEAGLPNIRGSINGANWNQSYGIYGFQTEGSIYKVSTKPSGRIVCEDTYWGSGSDNSGWFGIDASISSSIYGNSSTVQPPALFVYFWQRTG